METIAFVYKKDNQRPFNGISPWQDIRERRTDIVIVRAGCSSRGVDPGCDRIIRQISRNQPGKFVVQLFSGRHAILKAALSRIKSSSSGRRATWRTCDNDATSLRDDTVMVH